MLAAMKNIEQQTDIYWDRKAFSVHENHISHYEIPDINEDIFFILRQSEAKKKKKKSAAIC